MVAMCWLFICRLCLRAIRKILEVLKVTANNVRKEIATGIKFHAALLIQNLSATTIMQKIQRRKVVWKTRGTVTIVLYRKWRVKARRRSMDTTAKVRADTPDVM